MAKLPPPPSLSDNDPNAALRQRVAPLKLKAGEKIALQEKQLGVDQMTRDATLRRIGMLENAVKQQKAEKAQREAEKRLGDFQQGTQQSEEETAAQRDAGKKQLKELQQQLR